MGQYGLGMGGVKVWACLALILSPALTAVQDTKRDPLLKRLFTRLVDEVMGPEDAATEKATTALDLSVTIDSILTEDLPVTVGSNITEDIVSQDRIDAEDFTRPTKPTHPTRPTRPTFNLKLPSKKKSFRQEATTAATTTTTTPAPSDDTCSTVCNAVGPATSVITMGLCAGTIVYKVLPMDDEDSTMDDEDSFEDSVMDDEENSLTQYIDPSMVCPVSMVTWGLSYAVSSPAICDMLCPGVTAAARRVDGEEMTDMLYDYTGVYISPYSLLSPVLYTARVILGTVITIKEITAHTEDGVTAENRTITGELCENICDSGESIVLAVAVVSCGGSLLVDTFTDDSFVEDLMGLVKPSVVCPLAMMVFGVYSTLVAPALCDNMCDEARSRMPPISDLMPTVAVAAGAYTLYDTLFSQKEYTLYSDNND